MLLLNASFMSSSHEFGHSKGHILFCHHFSHFCQCVAASTACFYIENLFSNQDWPFRTSTGTWLFLDISEWHLCFYTVQLHRITFARVCCSITSVKTEWLGERSIFISEAFSSSTGNCLCCSSYKLPVLVVYATHKIIIWGYIKG